MTLKQDTYPQALKDIIPTGVEYIPRDLGDGSTDLEVLEYALKTHQNVLIVGPTGVAKTRLVRKHCEALGLAFVNIPGYEAIDMDQLLGQPVQKPDGTIGWRYGALPLAAAHGKACIYLDEVNGIKQGNTMMFHGMMDDRREVTLMQHGEQFDGPLTVKLADDAQVVATMNIGYKGTRALNEAFAGRFDIVIDFDYDPNVDQYLVGSKSLQKLAGELRAAFKAGELVTPTPTKRMERFEQHVVDVGYTFAVTTFVNAYHPDERAGVRSRFEAAEDRLLSDYGLAWVDADVEGN